MENKYLKEYEQVFLKFHYEKHFARYIKVFCNKASLFPTKVVLYSQYKRKLKYQPTTGELTLCKMFQELETGTFYFIPDLLNEYSRREEKK